MGTDMTGAGDWRGVVNGVLYVVQFERDLDDGVVAARAAELVARPPFGRPVAATVQALRAALASGEPADRRHPATAR